MRIFANMIDIYLSQSTCFRGLGRHIVAFTVGMLLVGGQAFAQIRSATGPGVGISSSVVDSSESFLYQRTVLASSIKREFTSRPMLPRAAELNMVATNDPLTRDISDHFCPDCAFKQTGLNTFRMTVATGIVGLAAYSVFYYEQSRWWEQYSAVKFHFDDHLDYAYNFDKLGHVFGTYAWALGVARLYEWGGVKPKTAALVGALFGWAAQFQVEVYDGYIPRYGFDRFDIAANTLGAGWFYAQQRIQTLRNWHFRMGYYPEKIRLEDGSVFEMPADQILADDYANQSYWMAVRLQNYLPKEKKKYWPGFLMLSAGVALDNWVPGSEFNDGHLAYYLSVDLDWAKILPQEYMFGRAFADLLNMFRLPFPAIRLHPSVEFVPMYLGN